MLADLQFVQYKNSTVHELLVRLVSVCIPAVARRNEFVIARERVSPHELLRSICAGAMGRLSRAASGRLPPSKFKTKGSGSDCPAGTCDKSYTRDVAKCHVSIQDRTRVWGSSCLTPIKVLVNAFIILKPFMIKRNNLE